MELYDLSSDPSELEDLAKERPDDLRTLLSGIDAILAAAPPIDPGGNVDLDYREETLQSLRALGYVD